ncbi:DUF6537 domain-containing protein [Nocardia sp. NPDC002869]|uniref:DUF6537 domain-containing protein n=1 Tax=Nocardia sp. NPDC002869 TaxID=3161032 RepID=UPI00398CEF4F
METILQELKPDNHSAAVEIAELPDMIRGYEQVKARNVAAYHDALATRPSAYRDQREPARQAR